MKYIKRVASGVSAFALVGLSSSVSFAHAKLLKSEPPADAVLNVAPTQVVLHFSEALELAMCKAEVKDARTGEVVSDDKTATLGEDSSILKIGLKPLKAGTYEVSFKAVAKDAHKMPGNLKFTFTPSK